MVCFVFCLPLQTTGELRKTSNKLKAHVLETMKVVERKRRVKELTCPLFWVSWGFKGWITALIKTGKPSISMDWLFMEIFDSFYGQRTEIPSKNTGGLICWQNGPDINTEQKKQIFSMVRFSKVTILFDIYKKNIVVSIIMRCCSLISFPLWYHTFGWGLPVKSTTSIVFCTILYFSWAALGHVHTIEKIVVVP